MNTTDFQSNTKYASDILSVIEVSKEYNIGGIKTKALDQISFTVPKGSFFGIMGSSGSGKTTLLNLISALDTATEGNILIDNRSLTGLSGKELAAFRRKNLGFIFQDYNLLDTLTLRENITLALTIQKMPVKEIREKTEQIAEQLNIYSLLDKYPYEVSGGQRQRCACARAVLTSPALILADEPTGALDCVSAASLMEIMMELNQQMGATILMVTHDVFSASYCSRILWLRDGKICNELNRSQLDRASFFKLILQQVSETGGTVYVP